MEPRCNHLGNPFSAATMKDQTPPQWSPGVITWETPTRIPPTRSCGSSLNGAQV